MDVLDNYKKAWKNQANNDSKFSKEEIFKMCHKRSSSIVKWIFIIGMIEFFVSLLILCFSNFSETITLISTLGIKKLFIGIQIAVSLILFNFLYLFYKNWKNISVTDNTKELMLKILKTRKTVKHYMFFNISLIIISFLMGGITSLFIQESPFSTQNLFLFTIIFLFLSAILFGLLWGIYQLLYGILLKKLHINYKELANFDE